MSAREVENPIINSPYEEPRNHWNIHKFNEPRIEPGRRAPTYFYSSPNANAASAQEHLLGNEETLDLVESIREPLSKWRELALKGEGGVTRVTMELLKHWRREGRAQRLFFAQLEAAETIIFLTEARSDFLQGINIATDEPSAAKIAEGYTAFRRRCCKMATGTGKTTVMAMLAAWSILNKVNNKTDARFSDTVLVLCPNVTIRERLAEINPQRGEGSIYYTRDLVPEKNDMREQLKQGRLLTVNWHVLEPQNMQREGKVIKKGKRVLVRETIHIAQRNFTARGKRYLTESTLRARIVANALKLLEPIYDDSGALTKAEVETERYMETDAALVRRVLDKELGANKNILVFNDEAHHAYRLHVDDNDQERNSQNASELDDEDYYYDSATVWVDGLDRVHKLRGINFCVDFSATPYFLGRAGSQTNKAFPWTVSDFSLQDAIESGLVKIPQLAKRDPSGTTFPGYYNIWEWIRNKLTAGELGGALGNINPEAVLNHAHHAVRMLADNWREQFNALQQAKEPRPPVFILVCKTKKLADVVHDWIANNNPPGDVAPLDFPELHNSEARINTILVYSDMQKDMDSGSAKNDETRWMRYTLDTIGKIDWPRDRQGRVQYPTDFEELADKMGREKHPPGRDVRCIVSVSMLTEGWDCNTVTHILGLRPFMSQLLCEQVVGRGLRRLSYEVNENGLMDEEVAYVLGVPLSLFTLKKSRGAPPPPQKRYHIFAESNRAQYKIDFPRVDGYQQAIGGDIVCDMEQIDPLHIDGIDIPSEADLGPHLQTEQGYPAVPTPGDLREVNLQDYRANFRLQKSVYRLAAQLTQYCAQMESCQIPRQILFAKLVNFVREFYETKVTADPPGDKRDLFLSPYYRWAIKSIKANIRSAELSGAPPELPRYEHSRGPGSTAEVDFYTVREPYPVSKSHLNAIVPSTEQFEQQAAYHLEHDDRVFCFVKNEGMGFAIPYFYKGEPHEYIPDFIVRLQSKNADADDARSLRFLILETKGVSRHKTANEKVKAKELGAIRWVKAVNADGVHGQWHYEIAYSIGQVHTALDNVVARLS